MSPRTRLGQNFLVNRGVAERIVEWAEVRGERVFEVGPGRGALTSPLLEAAAEVTCVELDERLAGDLALVYGVKVDAADAAPCALSSGATGTLRIVVGNALDADLDGLYSDPSAVSAPVQVVANLPYDTGTAIVRQLLAQRGRIRSMVVMLQREVVDRLVAKEGGKAYGILSIMTHMFADVEPGMIVAPGSFRPAPKVSSRIVRITPLAEPRFAADEAAFRSLVETCFAGRRKMLRNTLVPWLLRSVPEERIASVFEEACVLPTARPETVSVEAFATFARAFARYREASC